MKSVFKRNGFVKLIKVFGYNSLENIDNFYNEDGLIANKNLSFLQDETFINSYNRGLKATEGLDFQWRWRFNIGLWAAQSAVKLDGDFVECGVAKGFLSSGIMHALNWNNLNKEFYLLDTFEGLVSKYLNDAEKKHVGDVSQHNKNAMEMVYCKEFEKVQKNFSEWNKVVIIKGPVPDTLPQVNTNKIAFLHIDMNCAFPERKAIEYFWPKMVLGGVVLLDDYAFPGHEAQQIGLDEWARLNQVKICALPTGQGLILKTS